MGMIPASTFFCQDFETNFTTKAAYDVFERDVGEAFEGAKWALWDVLGRHTVLQDLPYRLQQFLVRLGSSVERQQSVRLCLGGDGGAWAALAHARSLIFLAPYCHHLCSLALRPILGNV